MVTYKEIEKAIEIYGYRLAQLSTYVKQLEIIIDRLSDQKIYEAAPCYFGFTVRMYWQTIITDLAKMYSGDTLSLHKLIGWCEQNKELFPNKKTRTIMGANTDEEYPITNEYNLDKTIAKYRKKRDENKDIIGRIKNHRDKVYAHMDKDYYLKPDRNELKSGSKITLDDVKQLIEAARELINELSSNISGGIIADEYVNADDVEHVFNLMECGKKHYAKDAMAEHYRKIDEQRKQ